MYIFAEPVTEERADQIQTTGEAAQKKFARTVVGVGKDDPEVQAAWHNIQDEVDEQVDEDRNGEAVVEVQAGQVDQVRDGDALAESPEQHTTAEQEEDDNDHDNPVEDLVDPETTISTEDIHETDDGQKHPIADSIDSKTTISTEEISATDYSHENLTNEPIILETTASTENMPTTDEGYENSINSETIVSTEDVPAPDDGYENPVEESIDSETTAGSEDMPTAIPVPRSRGPLMGWTLTIRNKVNGGYVERPEKIDEGDDWKIEYHIQDIPEGTRWKLYEAVTHRRHQLVGHDNQAVDKGLQQYRELIQRYSDRGREWRKKQDKVDEAKGVQLFRPLGPGSEAMTFTK